MEIGIKDSDGLGLVLLTQLNSSLSLSFSLFSFSSISRGRNVLCTPLASVDADQSFTFSVHFLLPDCRS